MKKQIMDFYDGVLEEYPQIKSKFHLAPTSVMVLKICGLFCILKDH
jgi:hypothetical protein